jgi:hypothetical protein
MNQSKRPDPDAFAHSSAYLAVRRFVRGNAPVLIGPWTFVKRIAWSIRYPTAESRFKRIYQTNYWANVESLSGEGSTLEATCHVRKVLVEFVQKHQVNSLLDVPCGDFNWMKEVNLGIPYIGADIVDEIIARNQKTFATNQRSFQVVNLIKSPLPRSDLVLSRDCLNHFSFQDIERAIENIRSSGARYLAVTQFPFQRVNRNQESGFTHRELNFCLAPFNWPQPLAQYDEQFHPGKHLSFWKVSDLPPFRKKADADGNRLSRSVKPS